MRSKKIETGGKSNVSWKIDWKQFSSDDCKVAIQAAESMASRFREDVAIMPDLAVVLLRDAQQTPLEIIRYQYKAKGFSND